MSEHSSGFSPLVDFDDFDDGVIGMSRKVKKAVFPVAGLGTRFLPVTKASPKEMLPLVDKPLIQYAVEEAVAAGIQEIVFITGRGKRAIEDHFDISVELEQSLERRGDLDCLEEVRRISNLADCIYIRQKEPLGLGHAILCAQDVVGDEPFAVLLGDDIMDGGRPAIGQAVEIFEARGGPVVAIEPLPEEQLSFYGVIDGESLGDGLHRIRDLVEKPALGEAPSNLAVIGRYVLTPEIFGFLRNVSPDGRGEIQLTEGLRALARTQSLYGFQFDGKRYDAGNVRGFLEATVELALKRPDLREAFGSYLKDLEL
jgi:UTP--glucose-1-phosphate uridylyltransferase